MFETHDGVIFMENKNCGYFNVFCDMLQWKLARLIWIAFYKNEKNKKCFIATLPKAIITNYIFQFIGYDDQSIKEKTKENAFIKANF